MTQLHPTTSTTHHSLLPRQTLRVRGFTLIEILVVIAIIAVLAGILLAALSGVNKAAKRTQTNSLMQSFARACDEFALDHGRYPGLLPDTAVDGDNITSTQNAMLELMGGARVKNSQSPTSVVTEYVDFAGNATVQYTLSDSSTGLSWDIAFDASRFGEGPWINGRVYEPYFSPKKTDLKYTPFDAANPGNFTLPSLIDAWETPIIYLRAGRKNGPIIDDPIHITDANYELPQFDLIFSALDKYFEDALNANNSVLAPNVPQQSLEKRMAWLTLLLAHPIFWESGSYPSCSDCVPGTAWGTTRGRYVLMSAGSDGIYFEIANEQVHTNQVVDPNDPSNSLLDPESGDVTPTMMETFDDVIVYGGA